MASGRPTLRRVRLARGIRRVRLHPHDGVRLAHSACAAACSWLVRHLNVLVVAVAHDASGQLVEIESLTCLFVLADFILNVFLETALVESVVEKAFLGAVENHQVGVLLIAPVLHATHELATRLVDVLSADLAASVAEAEPVALRVDVAVLVLAQLLKRNVLCTLAQLELDALVPENIVDQLLD